MAQYIPKSAVVAEIRKRFDEYTSSILKHYDACKEAKAQELGKLLTILDTLEVKETDLEKEIDDFMVKEWEGIEENKDLYDMIKNDLSDIAKHFFELGIKAQKGE